MKNQKISGWIVAVASVCLLMNTGCIDAVTDGLTSGVSDGLSKVIEDFIRTLAANF